MSKGIIKRSIEDLKSFGELLDYGDLESILKSPRIRKEEKVSLLKHFDFLSDFVVKFLSFLISKNEMDILREIIFKCEEIYTKHEGYIDVEASVPKKMDSQFRERLVKKISEKMGKKIDFKEIISPELIGGMKLKIGDKVFDSSFRNEIDKIISL